MSEGAEPPSFVAPRQIEQRSEPEGPRSRVPRGIAKGGWASSPGGFKQSMQHSYEGVQRGCHTPAFSAVVH